MWRSGCALPELVMQRLITPACALQVAEPKFYSCASRGDEAPSEEFTAEKYLLAWGPLQSLHVQQTTLHPALSLVMHCFSNLEPGQTQQAVPECLSIKSCMVHVKARCSSA